MNHIKWLPLLALTVPMSLFAWGKTGHEVIAQIAYDYLMAQPNQALYQADYAALVQSMKAEDFLDDYPPGTNNPVTYENTNYDLAHWPDDLKSEQDYSSYAWHFEDNLWSFHGMPTILDLQTVNPSNVTWAVGTMVGILTASAGTGADMRLVANPNLRGRALAYLIHFVGDAHQPLHCSTRVSNEFPTGDVGGNSLGVVYVGNNSINASAVTHAGELHALWDGALSLFGQAQFSGCQYTSPDYVQCLASQIERDQPVGQLAWDNPPSITTGQSLSKWAQAWALQWCGPAYTTDGQSILAVSPAPEWFPLVQQNVYVKDGQPFVLSPVNSKLTQSEMYQVSLDDAYFTANNPVAEQRLAMAGYRLGKILQTVFDVEDQIKRGEETSASSLNVAPPGDY